MTGISDRFGFGGANVVPQTSGGSPSLADTLREVADDLQGHQVNAIVSAAVEASDQITGVSATGAECWITGAAATMEIRESDDSTVIIGSVPVGEHHTVYANEWIHINDTSSASNSSSRRRH